jgi:hypothetical protein
MLLAILIIVILCFLFIQNNQIKLNNNQIKIFIKLNNIENKIKSIEKILDKE